MTPLTWGTESNQIHRHRKEKGSCQGFGKQGKEDLSLMGLVSGLKMKDWGKLTLTQSCGLHSFLGEQHFRIFWKWILKKWWNLLFLISFLLGGVHLEFWRPVEGQCEYTCQYLRLWPVKYVCGSPAFCVVGYVMRIRLYSERIRQNCLEILLWARTAMGESGHCPVNPLSLPLWNKNTFFKN